MKIFRNPIKASFLHFFLVVPILVAAFYVRSNTFWLAHWSGDQEHYLALAMKLDRFGLDSYNLREVDLRTYRFALSDKDPAELIIGEVLPAEPGKRGRLLDLKFAVGITHYDRPLYYLAPAFPAALALSNRFFSKNRRYTAPGMNLNERVEGKKPFAYYYCQFYAVIVPLFFSLILVFLTFLFGKMLFSARIGLCAAAMMAANPVDILTSQRIWATDMVVAFTVLSLIVFFYGIQTGRLTLYLLSGAIFGIAVLTRQNVAVLVLPIWLYQTARLLAAAKSFRNFITSIFNKETGLFVAGTILVTAFWFLKTFQVYGTFVDIPEAASVSVHTQKTGFLKVILQRPPLIILLVLGIPYLSPVFGAAYFSLRHIPSELKGIFCKRGGSQAVVTFFWLCIGVFVGYFLLFRPDNKEHRYFLTLYPMIALLSAHELELFKIRISRKLGSRSGLISASIIWGLIILSAVWSIPIGIEAAVANRALIFKPF